MLNCARCDCELETTAAMEEANARAQVRLARIASHMRAPEVRGASRGQFGGLSRFDPRELRLVRIRVFFGFSTLFPGDCRFPWVL